MVSYQATSLFQIGLGKAESSHPLCYDTVCYHFAALSKTEPGITSATDMNASLNRDA